MAARQRRVPRWALIVLSAIVSALLSPGVSAQTKRPEGGEVTLEAKYIGDPSEINWKKDGYKVVDMERSPLSIHFYTLRDRATISHTDGSLTIRNLRVGDSGHYMAEALVNNIIHETHHELRVIACPAEPTITDNSNKDKIELSCASKTPGVTYEWWKRTHKVVQSALYTANRTREDVTLTCVVYVEKDVCKDEASITIHFTPARVTVKVGNDVTLKAEYTGDPTEIKWMMDGDKVAYMKLKPEFNTSSYRERASISRTNGGLTIRKLEVGDSGLYRAVVLANNIIQETNLYLTVIDNRSSPWMIAFLVFLAVVVFVGLGFFICCYCCWLEIKRCCKREDEQGNEDESKIHLNVVKKVTPENGNLQNNVTSADKGKYTAHC